MEKISGVIITYNEEKNVEHCIKTISSFCDEIVIVDSFSTDRTAEIAEKHSCKVYFRKPDTIINQINYATKLAKHNWVFCIDADERVSDELKNKIMFLKKEGFLSDGYSVSRLNYYINDFFKYCGWYPDRKIRLFNRSKGNWGGTEPHYRIIMSRGTKVEHLNCDLIHFSYRDIFHQIEKMNRFSSQAADSKMGKKDPFLVLRIIINPLFRFVRTYFLQFGFLGGVKGLSNSIIISFYVFCKYLKIWEATHKRDFYEIDKRLFDK